MLYALALGLLISRLWNEVLRLDLLGCTAVHVAFDVGLMVKLGVVGMIHSSFDIVARWYMIDKLV